ncbi:hypothetical protein M407DRAFT_29536 [Tulasnella calospora MUT 4182]|uniref:DRBM domain-containing protein n=1 Tax=Tulasnella calospora MUT 4182 TaxID=1051891 RepID=A0A0C3PZD0_9AGAM|nr:hypothetical protein M407DRAFT_29536 [Tulasnella calospora MUT 4182]
MEDDLRGSRYFMHLHNMVRSRRLHGLDTASVSEGPLHRPMWTFTIAINGQYFSATGLTKAQAREIAAMRALYTFGFLDC